MGVATEISKMTVWNIVVGLQAIFYGTAAAAEIGFANRVMKFSKEHSIPDAHVLVPDNRIYCSAPGPAPPPQKMSIENTYFCDNFVEMKYSNQLRYLKSVENSVMNRSEIKGSVSPSQLKPTKVPMSAREFVPNEDYIPYVALCKNHMYCFETPSKATPTHPEATKELISRDANLVQPPPPPPPPSVPETQPMTADDILQSGNQYLYSEPQPPPPSPPPNEMKAGVPLANGKQYPDSAPPPAPQPTPPPPVTSDDISLNGKQYQYFLLPPPPPPPPPVPIKVQMTSDDILPSGNRYCL